MIDLSALARNQDYPGATLYMVATPIGNAADISLRALHVLAMADRIAAEDTRNTGQLLARYGLSKPLIPAHQHNEHEAAQRIVAALQAGERVVYVSDAGTPGISDPGALIADAVRAAGLGLVPVPGASALSAALSVAGAWVNEFTFLGFLPTKTKQRADKLASLATHTSALVFYEAPHRIVDTVDALRDALGGTRRLLLARELTKLHESIHLVTLAEAPAWLAAEANRQRGEFVLVVEGASAPMADETTAHDTLLVALLAEVPLSAAARIAAAVTGAPRHALYERALALKGDSGD